VEKRRWEQENHTDLVPLSERTKRWIFRNYVSMTLMSVSGKIAVRILGLIACDDLHEDVIGANMISVGKTHVN
jgi:uncharacterized protein YunC (DUF1805 family)